MEKRKFYLLAGHGFSSVRMVQLSEILGPPKCMNMFKGLHLCTYDSTQNMQQVWPHLQVPRKKKYLTNCATCKCTCKVVNVHLSVPKKKHKIYLKNKVTWHAGQKDPGPIDNER